VLAFVRTLLENPDIEVIWADQTALQDAFAFLESRPDKTYSWCDALSFVVMRQRNLTEALSTDRHFDQEGFRRLLD
jgi:predicted nucleic acid-binding protein